MILPVLQLVDAPSSDATVLYDLHVDPSQFVQGHGLDWGTAPWAASPGSVGGRDGYRTVALTHVFGAERKDAETQLGVLARVLRRPEVYLRAQVTPSSQRRYFRLWRSPIGSISPDQIYLSDRGQSTVGVYVISLQLTADPYLLGELVTIPTIAISNDPAASTNPMWATLPPIQGDGPAPVIAQLSAAGGGPLAISLLSISQGPAAGAGVHLIQVGTGDTCTAGTDCDAGSTAFPSTKSGGSARTVSFASTTAMATRLTAPIPNTMAPGEYRVLVRSAFSAAGSGAASVYTVQAAATDPTGSFKTPLDPVNIGYVTGYAWADLGTTFVWPMGHDTSKAVSGAAGLLSLSAAVSPGGNPTPSWSIDAIALVPVALSPSTRYARETAAKLSQVGFGGTVTVLLDGESQWLTAPPSALGNAGVIGVFPQVAPGETNIVTFVNVLTGSFQGDSLSQTVNLDLSYYPRYDWPAP